MLRELARSVRDTHGTRHTQRMKAAASVEAAPVDESSAPAERTRDLLVVGDLNPDIVLRGDVVPRFGQAEQRLEAADVVLAGSGGIVAAGAARLGLRTSIVATIGRDPFGDLVAAELDARRVDRSLVTRVTTRGTGSSVILSAGDDRAILTFPGALELEDAALVTDEVLRRTRHLHLAGFFLLPRMAAAAGDLLRRAHTVGCTTSLDTNWDPSQRWAGVLDLLPDVDVFLPNENELLAVSAQSDPESAVVALRRHAPDVVVVAKRGAHGAQAWVPGQPTVRAAGIPVDVVDTTGAGDSFDAGFLSAWIGGLETAVALRWGCVAGGLSTRAAGGTASQATRAEIVSHR